MGRILPTIQEYVVKTRKKDSVFIGFNSVDAKRNLDLPIDNESEIRWYDDQNVNWDKREEFKLFMSTNMPNVILTEVFDTIAFQTPYLGTIAMDIDIGSPEELAINSRYESETGKPLDLDAVVYIMPYELAKKEYKEQKKLVL